MAADSLITYMNDHLAGARSALELLEPLIESTTDAPARQSLEAVRAEIVADRHVLEDLIRVAGGTISVVREMSGWIAEKFGRLKLVIDDPSNGPFRRFEALEVLALGIQGKSALWQALKAVAPDIQPLAAINFDDLIRRASEQHRAIEAQRLDTARMAFAARQNPAQ
jgi:hypothetical protein